MEVDSSARPASSSSNQASSSSSSGTAATMKRVAFLKGHTDSVICLNVSGDSKYLASGSEDGYLCVHSLQSRNLICRSLLSKYDAIAAVLFAPRSGSSSSSSEAQSALLFAAAGCELLLLSLTAAAAGEEDPTAAAAAVAAAASDLDVLCRREVTDDDISALAINKQGTYLAAADDAGDVTLFDLAKLHHQQQQQQQQVLQPIRVIKAAHAPLASSVSFRSHQPWQLLTAGMDNRIACWDFSRGRKCLAAWNMTEMTGISNPGTGISHPQPGTMGVSNPGSGISQSDESAGDGQMWNPPMVHAMAVPADSSSSRSGTQQQQHVVLPAAVQKRIVAAARGDGVIAVFDADGDAKPSSGSRSSSSKGSARSAAAAAAGSSKDSAAAVAAVLAEAAPTAQLPANGSNTSAVSDAPQQQQQQQQGVVTVQPGFHVCLGSKLGGHSVPAAAVVFLPLGSDSSRFLVSAGEDGRLLLWDWQAALLLQQQQQQQGDVAASPAAAAGQRASSQQQQQQTRGPKCLLIDKDHKRKVNALCCVPGSFVADGSSVTAAGKRIERCLLIVADTSSRISVYEVSVRM